MSNLKIYSLVINKDENEVIHDISLSLTDGDGKVEYTVGVLESIELFKNLADIMGKRSKNQKLNNLISDKELIYPFGYPDSILNDNITLFD